MGLTTRKNSCKLVCYTEEPICTWVREDAAKHEMSVSSYVETILKDYYSEDWQRVKRERVNKILPEGGNHVRKTDQ